MSRSAAALLVIIWLATAPTRAFGQDWELVRLSFGTGWQALPAIVAEERGFFIQEQLIVSGLNVSSREGLARSLAAGTTDFAATDQRTLLAMAAAELPVKVVSVANWDTQVDLVVPPGATEIRSLADLRGRDVGVTGGSDSLALLIRLLNRERVPLSDVDIKVLPATRIATAFEENLANAVLETRDLTSGLVEAGQAQPILTYEDIVDALGVVGAQPLVVRSDLIETDPALVQRFLNAWVKALVYINLDPDDAAGLLQIFHHRQGVAISKDVARSWLEMTRYDRYDWSAQDIADAEYSAWALKEVNVLNAVPSLAGYVENRFAQQAWTSLQGGG